MLANESNKQILIVDRDVATVELLRPVRHETHQAALNCDELVLEPSTTRVTARGELLNLRGVEYRLLEFLMSLLGYRFATPTAARLG